MLNFRTLTIDDKSLIQSFTLNGDRRNCDLSFANLIGWQFLYGTEIALFDGFLIFRFYADRHLAYMMPLGKGDLCSVLTAMMEDARQMGHPFLMHGLCAGVVDELSCYMPGVFHFICDRDYSDYIYARDDLATLRGKRLQGKRNHANRFWRSNPTSEYRPLTKELVPLCFALDDAWNDTKVGGMTDMLKAEYRSMHYVLEHLEELGIIGGTLFVDGKLVAFTYGDAINQDTFDVCVEKADVYFEGSYAAINQSFVQHLPERFRYINREEDLGVEGLRRAKLSYQPMFILEKFSVHEKHPLEKVVPPCQQTADKNAAFEARIKCQTRSLWKAVFGDTDEFMDLYFGQKYRHELNVFHEEDGHVVSALQCLPYTMTYGHDELEVSYVSGVCTREDLRNRGLMSNLLDEAHRHIFDMGAVFSFLIPAEPWLFGYYERFGYNTLFYESQAKIVSTMLKPDTSLGIAAVSESDSFDETAVSEYFALRMRERDCCIQHAAPDLHVVLADLFMGGGTLWVARQKPDPVSGTPESVESEHIVGLAFAVQREETVHVFELLSDTDAVRDSLLSSILQSTDLDVLLHEPDKSTVSQHRVGQLRVINVLTALRHYAGLNPDVAMDIRVHGDKAIVENNGIYRVSHGRAERLPAQLLTDGLPLKDFSNLDLAAFLMQDMHPYLSLMLN
jgi:predicted acetyltransferase